MKRVLALVILVFFYAYDLFSLLTPSDTFLLGRKYGISFYYDYNMHAVDMRQLSTVADSVPRSAIGDKPGFSLGGFFEYRLTERTSLMLKVLYTSQQAEIRGDTPETLNLNGTDTIGWSEHTLKTDLTNIRLEPTLKYKLFSRFSLYGGVSVGIRFDKSFTNDEIVKSPLGALFTNGTNARSGVDIEKQDKLGLQAAINFGFSFDIPVNYNGKYLIVPEVMFSTGFSDITNDISWDANSLKLGFSLMYSENPTIFKETKEIREKKQKNNTINVESNIVKKETFSKGKEFVTYDTITSGFNVYITENLNRIDTLFFPSRSPIEPIKMDNVQAKKEEVVRNGCLTFFSVASDGTTEFLNSKIKVEEFLSTSMKPLLNYIFFDYNSSEIPTRYIKLTSENKSRFNIDLLMNQNRLTTYYHILNIIGKRLEQNVKARITLVGCNSGIMSETDNLKLSKDRAEKIKKYLVDIWNISPDRINVKANNLPEKPSNIQEVDGNEENRRVEILSDNWDIIAPIIINDTLIEANPSQIRFYNNASNCMKINKWKLEAFQGSKKLVTLNGDGNLPERLTWRINDIFQQIPRTNEKILFNFEISDYDALKFERRTDSIEVNQVTIEAKTLSPEGDRRIDKYGLILFDYDQANLNSQNEKILDIINQKVQYNSKVVIKGYTDRIGEEEYNVNLSQKRASTIAEKIKNTKDIKYYGIGEKELLFNNDFPEGRFYSRTVNITVETPLE